MTVEELKIEAEKLGYYIVKKPRAIGRLKPCLICGRKITHYDIRTSYYPEYGDRVSVIRCPKCAREIMVHMNNDIWTKHELQCAAADEWNRVN